MSSKIKPCTPTKKSYNYFTLALKHKWYVFRAGLRIGCPIWRLITHDISKFSLTEYPYYQNFFFGDKTMELEFSRAWLHHQNINDHHWEYWMPRSGHSLNNDHDDLSMIEMTDDAALEMIADWIGASWAYGGFEPTKDNWPWMVEHGRHSLTKRLSYINGFKVLSILVLKDLVTEEFSKSVIDEIISKNFEDPNQGTFYWEQVRIHMKCKMKYKTKVD